MKSNAQPKGKAASRKSKANSVRQRILKKLSFEHRKEPLLSNRKFFHRQLRFLLISMVLIAVSLAIGTIGYCSFCGIGFVEGFYNASMILTGMGPALEKNQANDGIMIFSSFYALYSGIAFLTISAVLLAPAIHRLLHVLQLGGDEER